MATLSLSDYIWGAVGHYHMLCPPWIYVSKWSASWIRWTPCYIDLDTCLQSGRWRTE